jgi:hypothetical protein
MKMKFFVSGFSLLLTYCSFAQSMYKAEAIKKPLNAPANSFYTSNKEPLQPQFFIKLPVTSIKPGGWLRKALELQKEGLAGNLSEISIWLTKNDNAWLNKKW